MGLMDGVRAYVQGFFACKHPTPVARLELIPELEYTRYYWECPDCGAQWDD